ncbi:MAG: ABC transporter substrate-binding protein [Ruminococcus flavefaciens]|nr:ABC transporter substrate-binding protein [Ruminococcus flavefaciens]MCM1229051.1 ABC transporter substrate-binding protein [Ruminococcus flavefaciens]
MKFRKFIALCAVLVLSGCSSIQESSGESSEISPEIAGKTDINVSFIVNPQRGASIQDKAEKFSNSSDRYNVNLTVYYDYEDYYANSAFNRFSRDILSGNTPDVVILPPEKARIMKNKGYFADVSALMENYDGLKRDDLLDNVRESVEENGEIRLLYNTFFLETAAAKKSVVGDVADWSFEEMSAEYNKLPQDENHDFLYNLLDDGTFRRYITRKMTLDCIDIENNSCDFSEVIPEVMDFISSSKTVGSRYKTMNLPDDFENMLRDDRAVVNFFEINGINFGCAYNIMPFYGEDFTFVGMPSSNSSGAYTIVDHMYGITEKSENKEGAWEFLSSFFDVGYLKQKSLDFRGIPVTKTAVDRLCNNTSAYIGNSIRTRSSYPDGGEEFEITDEEISKIAEYIGSVKLEPYSDSQIENIIDEECGAVFAGERTPQECADILNDRIGTYLSECS